MFCIRFFFTFLKFDVLVIRCFAFDIFSIFYILSFRFDALLFYDFGYRVKRNYIFYTLNIYEMLSKCYRREYRRTDRFVQSKSGSRCNFVFLFFVTYIIISHKRSFVKSTVVNSWVKITNFTRQQFSKVMVLTANIRKP